MSDFAVEIKKLEKIWKHTNADALDLARVEGLDFQFVVKKDQYKEGDYVVYFPLDSIIPDKLIEFMGMTGKFSGHQHNRVKTVKLRGEISQGYVESTTKILEYLINESIISDTDDVSKIIYPNADITELLGVTKYEPEPRMDRAGNLWPLPKEVPHYDIQGCDRYTDIRDMLIDKEIPVCVTEKLEGTNFACIARIDGTVDVCSRSGRIEELETIVNSYCEAARTNGIIEKAKKVLQYFEEKDDAFCITLRGELIGTGIQGNIYKLDKHYIRIFDIMVNYNYISVQEFFDVCNMFQIETVPVISIGRTINYWLFNEGKTTIKEASNRKSLLNPNTMAEGVVIKPMVEMTHPAIGRLIIKQRSPEYLAKYDT